MIGPGEFIALAEETGLIMSIGTQVLRQAHAERGPDLAGRGSGAWPSR